MSKFNYLAALFLSSPFLLMAGPKQKKCENWIDASVKAKSELRAELVKSNMPVVSTWVKKGQKAEKFTVDLKNVDKLILIVSGGPDGSDYDQAVWGNARLIAADGSSVWLDETPYEYGVAGWAKPKMNINAYDKKLVIGGKDYPHGVFCHANGTLVYAVNNKYVRFEAEVGIDDTSSSGSAYFQAMNVFPKTTADALLAKYPAQIGVLSAEMDGLDSWLITNDASVERETVKSVANKLKDPSFFQHEIAQVASVKEVDAQIRRYLELFEEAQAVLDIQNELAWLNVESIGLAFDDMKKQPNFDAAKYQPLYNELIRLTKQGFNGIYKNDAQAVANAQKVLANKRTILLGNTLLDVDKVLVTRFKLGSTARQAMAPSLGTQANNWSNQQSTRREGFDAEIMELSNLRGDIKERTIFKPAGSASIADVRLHWDADRLMFSSLMPDKRWNVFEVNVDGTGLKPLVETVEKDLEFFDGTYLPDGRVIVTSNVGYQGVPCVSGSDPVGNMMIYNPKDKYLRRLTFDQDANWNPTVMPNGKVMYTRWEYTDLMHYYSRFVMHMNPDGTENKALYGSGSMFPNSTFDMHTLPGHSSAFVGIISGHHGVARSGRLLLFDPTKARKGAAGVMQEIPHRNRQVVELIKDELVNGVWPQFIKPFPLNDKYFLVAAKLDPNSLWGIYLVDIYDNVTLLKATEGEGYITPIVLKKQVTPPVIPDRVKLGDKEATVFIQDIYEGEGLRDVPRGTVKALRVLSYEYAYLQTASDHYAQGIQSGWDLKRLLGTVPVEEDGSVIFKVPANMPISLQPLDENGAAVQWMRSWFTGMPGEVVSCVGCHEDQSKIAMPKRVIASQKSPVAITPAEGGIRSFTFDLEMQPVLDRACVACHNGAKGGMDLRGGKKDDRGYGTSYLAIHPFIHRQGSEADMSVLQPMEYHATTSELVRMLKRGHHNVKLTDKEWRTVYNWIDFNAPDKGYFKANIYNGIAEKGIDQIKRRQELNQKYADGVSVDWQAEIAAYAGYLKGKGEITPEMPEALKPMKQKKAKAKGWPFDAAKIKEMLANETSTRKEIEVAPGMKMTFVRIPAGEFVMGSYSGNLDNAPISKVKVKKAFWMAEAEVTNAQYAAFDPKHDSRYVDQFWKDHVNSGYPANLPHQPVMRISWNQAMDYCKDLSAQTGLNITLPTEAQWEWACRAGSDTDFWYGDLNSDFGKKENLADSKLSLMAVSGVNPQPMSKKSSWYKYYNFVPKEASVDDGNMLQSDSKSYEANPFGLYSMHGNIAEWTRSEYQPYPYSEKVKEASDLRVVRGGSYWERPKHSTAYTRKAYLNWQRNNLVGFRIIIED